MRISLNWLSDYIPVNFSINTLRDHLTMVGFEVEEVQHIQPVFQGVIVGEIKKVVKHPNADQLKCCEVNIGAKVLNVVCGAPNVQEGLFVPVAKVGAVIGEGNKIKTVSIRRIQSYGMICSEKELGLGDDHSGILILDRNKFTIGQPFFPFYQKEDTIFDINVTPNRPDCLSHLGIAREIGIISGKTVSYPADSVKESDSHVEDLINITIKNKMFCPRYSARVIKNVQVESSPDWLKRYLENVGFRSVNNVVDITNYVLLETGQPLHAFDYDLISKKRIVVRKAYPDEKFTTLDDITHTLTKDDLLICDNEKGVALAGVMGGNNSEVSENTKNILLESAHFDPMTIRKTSKRLGINTEASQRFERGVDPNLTLYAINRAAKLLSEIAEGAVAQGIVDIYPEKISPWKITLRYDRIQTILGIEIPENLIIQILKGLGLHVQGSKPYHVTIPTYRPDLKKEIDLIEELARHYGYDKINAKLTSQLSLEFIEDPIEEFIEKIRTLFVGMGFNEANTNSLVSLDQNKNIFPHIQPVGLQNPLSPETGFLRISLIPGLLNTLQWNRNRSIFHIRLFEIGHIFSKDTDDHYHEEICLSGVLSGPIRSKPFWGEEEVVINFYNLKGIIESFLTYFNIPEVHFINQAHNPFQIESSLSLMSGSTYLGCMGKLRRFICEHWEIDADVFTFEIKIQDIYQLTPNLVTYQSIPRFPVVKRDLAILIDKKIPVESLKERMVQTAGENCHSIDIFDIFQGQQIPKGQKSVGFSLTFLSNERTLKEEEIDPIIQSIIKLLETEFSAKLRS